MAAVRGSPLLRLPMLAPVVGVLVLAVAWRADLNVVLLVLVALVLAGSVLAAVHHAEVVAHRVGEPFGSLVLGRGHRDRGRADRHADGLR